MHFEKTANRLGIRDENQQIGGPGITLNGLPIRQIRGHVNLDRGGHIATDRKLKLGVIGGFVIDNGMARFNTCELQIGDRDSAGHNVRKYAIQLGGNRGIRAVLLAKVVKTKGSAQVIRRVRKIRIEILPTEILNNAKIPIAIIDSRFDDGAFPEIIPCNEVNVGRVVRQRAPEGVSQSRTVGIIQISI